MIDLGERSLLMIEPTVMAVPLQDVHTRRAYSLSFGCNLKRGRSWRGMHSCVCGATSTSFELITPQGRVTNSLFCHYVECHRPDVPDGELIKLYAEIMGLDIDRAEQVYFTENERRNVVVSTKKPVDKSDFMDSYKEYSVKSMGKSIDKAIIEGVIKSLKEKKESEL